MINFKLTFRPKFTAFMKGKGARVGVIGSVGDDEGVTPSEKAFVHEFGYIDKKRNLIIPARPWFRPVMFNKDKILEALSEAYRKLDIKVLGATLHGEVIFYLSVMQVGDMWQGTMIQPLAQSTIEKKKSDELLRHKGDMWQSLTFEELI